MELEMKLVKVGNATYINIPAFLLKQLGKKAGDTIKIKITEKRKGVK